MGNVSGETRQEAAAAFDWSATPLGSARPLVRRTRAGGRGGRGNAAGAIVADVRRRAGRAVQLRAARPRHLGSRVPLRVRVDDSLAEMNGLAPADHIGRNPAELLPDLDGLDKLFAVWREILETGIRLNVEVVGATPALDGLRSWNEHFFPSASTTPSSASARWWRRRPIASG
ncbi:hypothetical protein AB5I41_11435 [Sphingomonas sp. MMS24-JH45]